MIECNRVDGIWSPRSTLLFMFNFEDIMDEVFIKVKSKETDDFYFFLKGSSSKYYDGLEYVQVKRNLTDRETHFILRSSFVTSWK